MRVPKSLRLAAPLKEFKIPIVSWRPNPHQLKDFQENRRITYSVPEPIKISGREWYSVAAYDVKDELLGYFILPIKYYPLWRRLVYGALLQEKMYEAWIKRTSRLRGKSLTAFNEEEIRLKKMAGVRLVQYLLYRRLVLEELMKLRFEKYEPVVHSLIEFGIRESRDWLFETFENAKKEGAKYFYLDPTVPKNEKEFERGYHKDLEVLKPPEDDDWWDGDFTHFDFNSLFSELAKTAPETMADESFGQKWIIDSTIENEPEQWDESKVTFYSDFFLTFLKEADPRDDPRPYLRWYCNQMDDSEVETEFRREMICVLDEKALELTENCDIKEYIRSLRNGVEQILQDYCRGMDYTDVLEKLMEVFGRGSEVEISEVLDRLGLQSFGLANVDICIAEALIELKEVTDKEKGKETGKGKGKETGKGKGKETGKGKGKETGKDTASSSEDTEMGELNDREENDEDMAPSDSRDDPREPGTSAGAKNAYVDSDPSGPAIAAGVINAGTSGAINAGEPEAMNAGEPGTSETMNAGEPGTSGPINAGELGTSGKNAGEGTSGPIDAGELGTSGENAGEGTSGPVDAGELGTSGENAGETGTSGPINTGELGTSGENAGETGTIGAMNAYVTHSTHLLS